MEAVPEVLMTWRAKHDGGKDNLFLDELFFAESKKEMADDRIIKGKIIKSSYDFADKNFSKFIKKICHVFVPSRRCGQ